MENSVDLREQQKYNNIITLIYKGLYILMFAYVLFYPHLINTLNYYIGRATILLNIVAVFYISYTFIASNKAMLTWAFLFSMLISVVASTEEMEINQLIQNVSSFLCLSCFIEGQGLIKIDKSFVKFIGYINVIMCIIFFAYSFMPFAFRVEGEHFNYETTAFTLGYSNPNAAAMMLLYTATVNLISMRCKVYNKYFGFLLHAILVYLTYRTSSRTATLCILILTLFAFITFKKIPKIFLFGSMAVPIAYITVLPYLKSINFLEDVMIFGKSLYTLREEMFVERLGYLDGFLEWVFGDLEQGMFINHHNGILTILVTLGLFGLGIYLLIWCKNIIPYMGNTNKVSYMAIVSLMIVLIQTSSEAAFLVGIIPYNIMLSTLFIFVRFKNEYIENESEEDMHEAFAY